jgi:hypothetical protein
VRRAELKTLARKVKDINAQEAQPKVRSAFLVDTYIGYAREVLIQLGDPALGRGATVKATLAPGAVLSQQAPGTCVSVVCRHGHFEIIGLRGSGA